jgi:hypothetical protein
VTGRMGGNWESEGRKGKTKCVGARIIIFRSEGASAGTIGRGLRLASQSVSGCGGLVRWMGSGERWVDPGGREVEEGIWLVPG